MRVLLLTIFASIAATAPFSSTANAADMMKPMQFVCVTPHPTTSIVGQTSETSLKVRVLHHNSTKYMPLYTGTITPNDLPAMAKKAEALTKLGDEYMAEWKIEKCKFHGGKRFECFGGEPSQINGVTFRPYALHTSKVTTESSIAGKYTMMQVNMSVEIDGQTQSFTMEYADKDCEFEY